MKYIDQTIEVSMTVSLVEYPFRSIEKTIKFNIEVKPYVISTPLWFIIYIIVASLVSVAGVYYYYVRNKKDRDKI